jgi:transposase
LADEIGVAKKEGMPRNWCFPFGASEPEVTPMVVRRAYKRVKVNSLEMASLLQVAREQKSAVLGLDVAKLEIVACLRWESGLFERPWSVCNPLEVDKLVEICERLIKQRLKLRVALESTGTYADSVRMAMSEVGLKVIRVGGKSVSDYREIFDGVPSQHDGKDAAMIAELCAIGKGTAWTYETPSESMCEISYQVRRMDAAQKEAVQWHGRMESQLARHWPELSQLVKPGRTSVLRLLLKYGSPAEIAAGQGVVAQIMKWSKGMISEAKAFSIVQSSGASRGLPMNKHDCLWMQEICERLLDSKSQVSACENKLRKVLQKDAFWSRYLGPVSAGTLGVILSKLGDPRKYSSAGAFLKAAGLNLKELSSGSRIGEKAITKRGPSMVRRWMYFWAMRSVQREELREWYYRFHNQHYGNRDRSSAHRKMKGLTCMMRKLMRSLWSSMSKDEAFDYNQVVGAIAPPKRRKRKRTKL